jgi:protein-tyrosine phosphatase
MSNDANQTHALLFICLGNICRSPLAKAIFVHQATQRGMLGRFKIDSCGTGGWHAGGPADPRSVMVAAKNGVTLEHVARQVCEDDFERFDLLLAMDQKNHSDLIDLGAPREKIKLFRSFDPTLADVVAAGAMHKLDVPDPYYGGHDGFDRVYDMVWRASEGLLARYAS